MGYMRHTALGGITTDVATAAAQVVTDPCLYQVTQLIQQLHEAEQAPKILGVPTGAKPTAPTKPPPPVAGIGLCQAVTPLKAVIWVRKRPWVVPVGVVGVVGIFVGLGYLWGRSKKR
jgi:hypothetical protein